LGSFEPQQCFPGSYNPLEGMEAESDCRLCPPGTFQDKWGQEGCKVCGQFADSIEGQDICECIGNNRAYSPEDATCRCKSGYDYIDESNQSKGNVSDLTDCFPLVFENCRFNGQAGARQPDGTCVAVDDCAEACSGEPGTRSAVLGVCSCDQTLSVDAICNQDCRRKAPSMGFKSSYQIVLTSQSGSTLDFDLTEAGNVYGGLEKCRTDSGDCDIKTAEIGSNGFEGVYGVPRTIQNALRRRRMLGHAVH